MTRLFFFLIFLSSILSVSAQDITGRWVTIDDDGVTRKSVIEIWKSGNEYKGKLIDIFDAVERDNVCTECDHDDPRYNKKVLGMTILEGLQKEEPNLWDGGAILDPRNGSVYECKMWIDENGNIMIRGYIGFSMLGRTQTWVKEK